MKCKTLVLLVTASWLALAGAGMAQSNKNSNNSPYIAPSGNGLDNPDWAEESVPPPPAFSLDTLIPLDMPPHVSVKVGVDPETIVVGGDGVVRYVIVMRNATGNTNAIYEGIRCVSDEVKTYARLSSSGEWKMAQNPPWKDLTDNMPSQHAKAFARQGGCQGGLATSKQEIINALKATRRPTAGSRHN